MCAGERRVGRRTHESGVAMGSRRPWSGVVAVVVGLVLVLLRPIPAQAAQWWESPTTQWYDGGISYSSVINCPSMIFGSPYYENGVGAFASYASDPDNARPAVGDTTWIKYS